MSQRLDKNHPQYQAAKSEVEKLRSNLDEQIRIAGGSIAGSARIAQARVGDLQAALAAQKARVLDLSTARNEVKVLSNEMETAQKAYEAASQRYSQTNMESQFNQTDSAVLNPATRPIRPTGPNLLLNMVIAVLLSLVFGSTFALIAESMDRRIRSAAELARLVPVPVLGVLELTSPI